MGGGKSRATGVVMGETNADGGTADGGQRALAAMPVGASHQGGGYFFVPWASEAAAR